jgi:pilus assembly protein TadC
MWVLGFANRFLALSSLVRYCCFIRYLLIYIIPILINISISIIKYMAMKRLMVSVPDEMEKALEKERKERMLETLPETVRVILSEYLRKN